MMQLIDIISATYTATDGWLDVSIEADIGNGVETLPFTYVPGDPHGLGPQVGAWLAEHPDFPIGEYVEPEAPAPTPEPYLWGVGQFGISPGEITGIETSVKFLAALYLDVGLYYLYFSETLPNTAYLAKAYDAATVVRVSEKGTDYIAVTATDAGGTPVDPDEISVEIIRVS